MQSSDEMHRFLVLHHFAAYHETGTAELASIVLEVLLNVVLEVGERLQILITHRARQPTLVLERHDLIFNLFMYQLLVLRFQMVHQLLQA